MLKRTRGQKVFDSSQILNAQRAGLFAHYIGGGSGRTWIDKSGNGKHASFVNSPQWNLSCCGLRDALYLDGVNACLSIPSTTLPNALTFSLKIRFDRDDVGQVFIESDDGGNYLTGLYFSTATKKIRFACDNGSSNRRYFDFDRVLIPGGIYHICVMQESPTSTPILILNGEQITASTIISAGTPVRMASPLYIGAYGGYSEQYFKGIIDDVRIYSRAISIGEAIAIYQSNLNLIVSQNRIVSNNTFYIISGIVQLSGIPVSGAKVRCIRQSDNIAIAYATTNEAGEYLFSGLDVTQKYHLSVEYQTESQKYNALSYWDIEPVLQE